MSKTVIPEVLTNIPRTVRAQYVVDVQIGRRKLRLLSPNRLPNGYANRQGWWFVTDTDDGGLVLVSKYPQKTRDIARAKAEGYFGQKASEWRPPRSKKPAVAAAA